MLKDLMIFIGGVLFYVIIDILLICTCIKKRKVKDILEYLKLNKNVGKGILIGTIISSLYLIFLITKGKVNNNLNVNFNIGIRWFYGFTVGFLEEIPMRGLLLNKFQEKLPFAVSNIAVTIIFVLLHFPNWIIGGVDIMQSAVSISIVSLLFGYLVKEYNSLWITIICHSVFNISIWIGLI